ncbi:MAG: ATP-dependent helicase [Azospira oryzae]|nr:MAG: ATP-dependent helicase [Azospira oryzae]
MDLPFELSEQKKTLLKTSGNILTLGGPGAGKTTISLLKARFIIEHGLKKGQKILFLSFARSTVTRVGQQAKKIITRDVRKQLEINTYHGFEWILLKSHGYLLNGGTRLRLLPPPEAASRLAHVGKDLRNIEKQKLFSQEGLIHFDLFAGLSADLLSRSQSLASIISDTYPFIILDEFQDTNADEWRLIKELGKRSVLIALGDLDQRIYEFRGADPARIGEFIVAFKPTEFDFGTENNRSNGTDIAKFGNDLLTNKNKTESYNDVYLKRYSYRKGIANHLTLKTEVLNACNRLRSINNASSNWSLGLFVPSKILMLGVSDYLATRQILPGNRFLPEISHEVAMSMEGPSLAAIIIARLMEKSASDMELQFSLLNDLHEHIRGRNGDEVVAQGSLKLAGALKNYTLTNKVSGSTRKQIIGETLRIAALCQKLMFTGDPAIDWITVRKLLVTSQSEVIQQVAHDAKYLRLLRRGALLNSGLGTLWRSKGSYSGACNLVRNALAQEHFTASTTAWKGIHVMTMHKSKAKEFDEVIIYEGLHSGRIAIDGKGENVFNQSRLALRVAVTRAVKRTTIITPSEKNCPFLY